MIKQLVFVFLLVSGVLIFIVRQFYLYNIEQRGKRSKKGG